MSATSLITIKHMLSRIVHNATRLIEEGQFKEILQKNVRTNINRFHKSDVVQVALEQCQKQKIMKIPLDRCQDLVYWFLSTLLLILIGIISCCYLRRRRPRKSNKQNALDLPRVRSSTTLSRVRSSPSVRAQKRQELLKACRERMSVTRLLYAGPLPSGELTSSVQFGQFNRSNLLLMESNGEPTYYTFDQCYEISTDQSPMSLDIRSFAMANIAKRVGTKLLVYGYDDTIKSSLVFGNDEERGLVHMLLIHLTHMSNSTCEVDSLSLSIYEISDARGEVCDLLSGEEDCWLEDRGEVFSDSVTDANGAFRLVEEALNVRHRDCHLVITLSVLFNERKQVDLDVVLLTDCNSTNSSSFTTLDVVLSAMSSSSSTSLGQLPDCFMTQQLEIENGDAILLGVIDRSKKRYKQNRALLNYCAWRDRISVTRLLFASPLPSDESTPCIQFGPFNRSNLQLVEDNGETKNYTFDQCYEVSTDQSPMSLDIRNFVTINVSRRVGTKLLVYGYDGKTKSSLVFGNDEERGLVHMLLIQLTQMSNSSDGVDSLSLLMYEISDKKRKVCDLLSKKKDIWVQNKSKVSSISVTDASGAFRIVEGGLARRHDDCHLVITLSVFYHGSKQVDLDVVLLAECGSSAAPCFATLSGVLSAMSTYSATPLFQLPKCFMTQQLELESGYVLLLGVAEQSKKCYKKNLALLNYCSSTLGREDKSSH